MIACLFVCFFACLRIVCLFGWLLACHHHHHHRHHPAATGQYLHLQITIIMMMLIVVIMIIVRSHLASSVRAACEGRLLTNDVRGYTNRNVD